MQRFSGFQRLIISEEKVSLCENTHLVIEVKVMTTPLIVPNLSGWTELFMNRKIAE